MSRPKAPPPPPSPIHPTALYDRAALMRVVPGVRASTISREIKLGRLRSTRRVGRDYFLGQWVLSWILGTEQGETARAGRELPALVS